MSIKTEELNLISNVVKQSISSGYDDLLKDMVAMGFDQASALWALENTQGNKQNAIELLLSEN